MIAAIIVTHGNLADELIETAKTIFGDFDECHPVSNAQKSPQTLTEEIEKIIEAGAAEDNYIMFVDFFGGSCCHACLSVEQQHENVRLITGVNLPMLLAFLYKRNEVDFLNLPEALTIRGHNSIRVIEADSL